MKKMEERPITSEQASMLMGYASQFREFAVVLDKIVAGARGETIPQQMYHLGKLSRTSMEVETKFKLYIQSIKEKKEIKHRECLTYGKVRIIPDSMNPHTCSNIKCKSCREYD